MTLDDAQLFGQSRTLRIKQLLGLNDSTCSLRSRRSRPYSDALIFTAFRGPQAQVNPLRTSSSAASKLSKTNRINDLLLVVIGAALSLVFSASCVRWAALDDVCNSVVSALRRAPAGQLGKTEGFTRKTEDVREADFRLDTMEGATAAGHGCYAPRRSHSTRRRDDADHDPRERV
jgi:hypothetical protein